MIDERNINNIIELIESSNQKIKNIKDVIEEQKSTFELPENDFKNLANVVEEVLRSRNFDNLGELFGNIDKNISFKTEFLKQQYSTLDENILKVQNISKHIDKDISDDVSALVDIVETFSYKIKILQGIIGDINNKITTYNGDKPEVFLKDFRSDCRDFDEEFEQVLRELKANFRRASEITNKLAKFDTGVDLAKELFSINISINAIMSAISVFDEKYRDLGKAFEESGLYNEFSGKIEDLSYNTKHLIRNIDSFNKIIEDGSNIKEQVAALEQKIEGINGLIQQLNQEGFLEFKALLSSIDNSDDLAQIKEKLESMGQEDKFEELRTFLQGNFALLNQEEKLDEIKNIVSTLNQGEQLDELKEILTQTLEGSDYIQELKSVASNLSHAKIFGQFEHILNEIKSNDKISLEKTDELLRIVSVVNFGEVEKEISFLTNDLEIILEEIKHSRSISDKSFSKIETIFDNFNLNDLKNRIYDFENHLKKFLQKEDLQVFSKEISAVVEKFELANGVIIDGFDDLDALKTQIMGFDEKFAELTDSIKNILEQAQEKFDSTIEAFDNGYKIDELNHLSSEILSNLSTSKEAVTQALVDSQEKLSFLIKTIDNSDKLEEIQEIIQAKFEQLQGESAEKLFALTESSQTSSEDLASIKMSLLDIVRENQEKFDETVAILDKKADAREFHDKLNFVLQTIEDKNAEAALQEISTKIVDEVNNGKYLLIDTIRESQIKLEEFVATIDNAEKIQDLKNVIENLFSEVHQTKDTVIGAIRDNQDRFELIVKAIDNTDRVEEINDLTRTIYSEVISSKDAVLGTIRNSQAKIEEALKLTDVNMKVDNLTDLSQAAIDEIKFTKEIIQNVGRSINPEVLNNLQASIEGLKQSISEVHSSVLAVDVKLNNVADKTDISMLNDTFVDRYEQLEYLIRAYDPTVEIGSIKENLEKMISSEDIEEVLRRVESNKDITYEIRSLLEEKAQNLELLFKSVENSDDINELRDFLFNIEREQKETRASIEALIRNAENTDDINYLKGLLLDVETEQKDLKNAIEELIQKSNDTSSVDGLHSVLSGIANEQKDLRGSIENIIPYDEFSDIKYKVDANKEALYELKSVLDERGQNLELLIKSLENSDDISDIKDIIYGMESEQKELRSSVEALSRNTEVNDRIDDLRHILVNIESQQKSEREIPELHEVKDVLYSIDSEQKDLKGTVETLLRNAENTDDINYLKGLLLDIETEQKDLYSRVEGIALHSEELTRNVQEIVKNIDNSELNDRIEDLRHILVNIESQQQSGREIPELHEVKDVLYSIGSEQKDLKGTVETLLRNAENTDDINYLKGLLLDIETEQKDIRSDVEGIIRNTEEIVRNTEEIARNTQNTGNFDELRDDLQAGLRDVSSSFDAQQGEIKNALEQIYNKIETAGNTDDINYLKGLLIDIEQEQKDFGSAIEEIVRNTQNSGEFDDLRGILAGVDSRQGEVKNALEQIYNKIENSIGADDINYLKGLLSDIEQEQRDLRMSLNGIVPYESLADIKHKVDDSKDMLSDLRSVLDERTQHLELVMKSIENTEDINELRDILSGIEQEQSELKNIIYQALQSSKNSDEIVYLKDVLSDVENDQKEIKSILDNYLVSQSEDLRGYLGSIDNKVDAIEDIRSDVSGFSREVENLKIGLDGVVRKSDVAGAFEYLDDIKNDLSGFTHDIAHLKQELETLSNNKDLEEAVEHLENIQYAIKESISGNSSLGEEVQAVKDKIVEIKNATDLNFDFRTTLSVIQEDQITLKALISSLDDEESFNIVKEQIRETEYAIRDCIEAAKAKDDLEQIKHQLNGVTQQIVVQVMEVFENISFEQETQEIKEYVDESHNNVKSVLSVLKTNIERLLDAPKPIYIEELRQEIEKIANNLDDIGPEMSEYVSTITSLRVSLEELSKTRDLVTLIDQRIGAVSVDTEELLRASREIAAQLELLYTKSEAKDDFVKVRTVLENILEKQQEQIDSFRNDDLKGGMDNVNLSINYINENLKDFMSDYRIFQDNLMETVKNVEGMGATFVQADSINAEFKKGVNETFKALKKEFDTVLSTVDHLYQDMNKVSAVTEQMVDTSARDKAEVLADMKSLRTLIEETEIDKLKDNFSTIIFSINGFLNNVDDKFAEISKDTQGAFDFAQENKDVAENIKNSIVHILEWTSSASRDYTRILGGIEAFRDSFDESLADIRQIEEIKNIVIDLDSALASRVEEVFERQIQNKFDAQILPEFELLDKKLDKRLTQKLEPITEAREQDKEELRFIITNQLSSETASLRDLVDAVEKNIVDRIQNSAERILAKDIDFSEVLDRINTEFVVVNEKIDDSLSKIDTELYQANVRLDDGLNGITQEVSGLNSTLEEGIEKVNRTVRNINFNEITNKLEEGFDAVNQKIDDTNLPQVIVKIDDEFSAMNKKLDIDFFEMNKRVVDEFNTIEEKLDARSDKLLQSIDSSNEQLADDLNNFTARIEAKSDQTVNSVSTIKDDLSKEFDAVAGKIDEKTNHLLRNVDVKMHVQGEVLSSALVEVKEELAKSLESFGDKTDAVVDSLSAVKEDINSEFHAVSEKLVAQSGVVLKNIEDTKVEIKDVLDKVDSSFDEIQKTLVKDLSEATSGLQAQNENILGTVETSREAILKSLSSSIQSVVGRLETQTAAIKELDETKNIIEQAADKSETRANENASLILRNIDLAKDSLTDLLDKISEESINSDDILRVKADIKEELDGILDRLDVQSGLVLKEVENSKDEIKAQLASLNSNLSGMVRAQSEVKGSVEGISQEIVELVDVVNSQSQKLDAINFDKSDLEQISSNLDTVREEITREIQSKETGTSEVLGSLSEVKRDVIREIKSIDTSSDAVIAEIQQVKDKLETVSFAEEVEQISSHLDTVREELTREIQSKETGISEVLGGLSEVKRDVIREIKSIDTSSDAVIAEIGETKSQLDEIRNRIDALSFEQEAQLISVSLDSLKDELKQEIKSIDNGSAEVLSSISSIKKEVVSEIKALDNGSAAVLDSIADAKNDLNVINGKLDAQTGLVVKNVEDSNAKLDKTLEQVTSKIESQSKAVTKNLDDNKKVVSQAINEISGKLDTQAEVISQTLEGSKSEITDIATKLSETSETLAQNIEASKEELEQELVQIIDKIDNQSATLSKAQDKKLKAFEEKLTEQERKIQAIDDKLDILISKLNNAQALDLSEVVSALESRMGSLDENIKKIVSFVDEE